jgi:hypothetical protein
MTDNNPGETTMLTYSGPISKAAFVAEMRAHAEADRLTKGRYWRDGRGCAVGCGVQTINARLGTSHSHGDHAALAAALGWPEWLARLEDAVFEGLPTDDAQAWPVVLVEAVPEGADLAPALGRILARILREVALPVAGDSAAVVERVARGWATGWRDDTPEAAAAWAEAAMAAAWAAEAAWAAAAAARAAAWAAAAAEAAARAAAWAAETRADAWRTISRIVLEEVARHD